MRKNQLSFNELSKDDKKIKETLGDSTLMWEDFLSKSIDCELQNEEVLLDIPLSIEENFSQENRDTPLICHIKQERTHHKEQLVRKVILRILTKRELEVFCLIHIQGKTQIKTAQILGISRFSVRRYLDRILQKLKKNEQIKKELCRINQHFDSLFEEASKYVENHNK